MVIKEENEASFWFLLLDKEMPFYCLKKLNSRRVKKCVRERESLEFCGGEIILIYFHSLKD